jgi:DNA-binding Xre family transcriptional regulator
MGKSKDLFLSTAHRICEVLNCSLDDAFGDVMKIK